MAVATFKDQHFWQFTQARNPAEKRIVMAQLGHGHVVLSLTTLIIPHPVTTVSARSYRAVKAGQGASLLVDCLLFGLSVASNKNNSVRCPESPPTCVRSPTKPRRALFICSRQSFSK